MLEHAYLIVLIPLIAAVLIIAFGDYLPLEGASLGIAAIAYAFVHSFSIMVAIYQDPNILPLQGLSGRFFEKSITWFQTGVFRMELGTLIDGLSSVMLVVVTLVSLLVQIFSVGYQHGKPRLPRYFAYLSLFTFSMLLLVIANNLLQFFIGWELVGVCSYLLIGFEFERDEAAYAGRKAFLTTKVGDLGFYIGLLLLFVVAGTFNIPLLYSEHVARGSIPPAMCGAIALLLFCGAVGKSAQVPLHVWLPDAMEGPTPVSALLHAATMVAAGVYMVARVYFLYEVSPIALSTVAWVGGITAFFAATMALVSEDIKRVLAFSTISQLGYMMLALGCGSVTAAMFHLTTHACFKALLFLGAGSVIHAVHTNDIWKMGGLSPKMPITFSCFGIATLAIAGLPPFAGFFSKDQILEAALETHPILFAIALFTAGLTAFYMTRVMCATFLAKPQDPERISHAHESGPSMTLPLMILAVPSAFAGFALKYFWKFDHWVHWEHLPTSAPDHSAMIGGLSFIAFLIGFILAYSMYVFGVPNPKVMADNFAGIHRLLKNRYYIDEFYLFLIDKLVYAPSRFLAEFDYRVIDQSIVDGFAWIATQISRLDGWFDDEVIDKWLVNGWGVIVFWGNRLLQGFQNGFAQWYLLVVVSGLALLIAWALGTPRLG